MKRPPSQMQRRQTGFTLIEVTVALVLTSMLAGLLTSALYFAGRTRIAVTADMQAQIQQQIDFSRFEQILSHCIPGTEGAEATFRGDEQSLECISTQSMTASKLISPLKVQLKISAPDPARAQLQYADERTGAGALLTLANLPSQAKFVYWADDGTSTNKWPPNAENVKWLPRRIEVQLIDAPRAEMRWTVTLQSTPQPQLNPPSLFGTILK